MHCATFVFFLLTGILLGTSHGDGDSKTHRSAEEVLHHPLILATLKELVNGKGVHVTVVPGCALNHLDRLLKTISTLLPIFYHGGTFDHKITVEDKCLIVFTCNNSKIMLPDHPYLNYFDIIFVVSDEWKNHYFGPPRRRLYGRLPPVTLYVSQKHLYLSAFQLEVCLSCESFLNLSNNRLVKQRALFESNLSVICTAVSTCALGSYGVLLELLRYKGAFVLPESLTHREWKLPFSLMKRLLRLNTIAFNVHWEPKMKELALMYYPRYAGVCHFEQSDVRIFVKKLLPFPKSTLLVLPFSSTIWIVLSVLFLITTCLLQRHKFNSYEHHNPSLALLLVCPLLQQSAPNCDLKRYPPHLATLLALWFLVAVVLSNAFKGSLTSFLQDIPLQGKLPSFFSESEASRFGKLSPVTYVVETDSDKIPFIKATLPLHCGHAFPHYRIPRAMGSNDNRLFEVASHPVEVFMNISFILERLCQYTQLDHSQRTIVTGPYMNQLSPFKLNVASLVRRGFEYGFFQRGMLRAEYLASQRNIEKLISAHSHHASQEPLALADLEPYFLVWSAGLASSAAVLFVELFFRAMHSRFASPRK